jgi:hypothetical protein
MTDGALIPAPSTMLRMVPLPRRSATEEEPGAESGSCEGGHSALREETQSTGSKL